MRFMFKTPASRVTRPNQAWAVNFTVLDFVDRPFVMLVADVATHSLLSATLTISLAKDIAPR